MVFAQENMTINTGHENLISVIMGIYNCESTLREAIESIIAQTYQNWELIMCDDGSTDNTITVAEYYVQKYPQKIRLLRNKENKGLNYTLNKCLYNANGEFVARMDGDDICSPLRFEKEILFLLSHPNFAFVSCNMNFFDCNGVWGQTYRKKEPVPSDLVYNSQFCHAAVMIRRDIFLDVGGYSCGKYLLRVEDYHLWIKLYAKGHRGYNILESLYQMRDDKNALKRRSMQNRINECYVKHLAIKNLNLPIYCYVFCLKPIFLIFIPSCIYSVLHKKRNRIQK